MGLAAAGAGAAEGLKDFLLQMLREDQLKNEQSRTAEGARHNLATESLTGQGIESTRSYRDQLQRMNDIKESELVNEHKRTEANRVRDDQRAALDDLLPGVMITPDTRNKAVTSGAAAPERFKDVKAFEDDFIGPLPSEAGLPGPQRGETTAYTLEGQAKKAQGRAPEMKTVIYQGKQFPDKVGKPVDVNYDAQGRTIYRGEDISNASDHYTAPQSVYAPVQSEDNYLRFNRRTGKFEDSSGAEVENPPLATPGATRTRQDLAEKVGSHFDEIQQMLDEAESKGVLGPIAGRSYTDFMAGKVGSTGNPEMDNLIGELRMNLGLARSGLGQLHGRGGANIGIVQALEKKMDEGHMSYNELTGGLRAMKNWVNTYATKKGKTTAAQKTDPADDIYQQYLNRQKPPQ